MVKQRVKVETNHEGKRLDLFCTTCCDHLSRKFVKEIIDNGGILVNGIQKKASYKIKKDEIVDITIPEIKPCSVEPENIPLDIVYEDQDVIVVNKPSGMVVHPAPGNRSGTLVNALMFHTKDLSGINGVSRPGIVHRIDKDTSGLLMVAKNDGAHQSLAEQLAVHSILRQYRGLVKGVVEPNKGTVDMPIGRDPKNRIRMAALEGGKPAVTHFEVIQRFARYTLMTFQLETGRTHQIRVHMQAIGHPLAGDPLYGGDRDNPFKTQGQCLHAEKLGFVHPKTGEKMDFYVPLPEAFQMILNQLNRL